MIKKDNQIRLLVVARDYKPNSGGIAEYANQLVRQLAKNPEYKIRVLCQKSEHLKSAVVDKVEELRVLVPNSKTGKSYSYMKRLKDSFVFTWILLWNVYFWKADIIWYPSCGVDYLLPLLWVNKPYVLTYHGTCLLVYGNNRLGVHSRNKHAGEIVKNRCERASMIVTNSAFTAGLVEDFVNKKPRIFVSGCGVDMEILSKICDKDSAKTKLGLENHKILLSIARLFDYKGHDIVIQALPIVIERIPELKFVIGGTGPYRRDLERLVEDMGLESYVDFVGYIPDEEISSYYSASDAFILNSRLSKNDVEGFGIVLLEAMAYGTPVIGGRSGGIVDAIIDEQTGLLVDPEDPNDVARAIIRLLDHPDYANKLLRNAQTRIKRKLNWEMIGQRLNTELKRVASASIYYDLK